MERKWLRGLNPAKLAAHDIRRLVLEEGMYGQKYNDIQLFGGPLKEGQYPMGIMLTYGGGTTFTITMAYGSTGVRLMDMTRVEHPNFTTMVTFESSIQIDYTPAELRDIFENMFELLSPETPEAVDRVIEVYGAKA